MSNPAGHFDDRDTDRMKLRSPWDFIGRNSFTQRIRYALYRWASPHKRGLLTLGTLLLPAFWAIWVALYTHNDLAWHDPYKYITAWRPGVKAGFGVCGTLVLAYVAAFINRRNKIADIVAHCATRYDLISHDRRDIKTQDAVDAYYRRYWGLKSDQLDYWMMGLVDAENIFSWFYQVMEQFSRENEALADAQALSEREQEIKSRVREKRRTRQISLQISNLKSTEYTLVPTIDTSEMESDPEWETLLRAIIWTKKEASFSAGWISARNLHERLNPRFVDMVNQIRDLADTTRAYDKSEIAATARILGLMGILMDAEFRESAYIRFTDVTLFGFRPFRSEMSGFVRMELKRRDKNMSLR